MLLLDRNKKIIAAVHSGWKGAYKNIITKVLKNLLNWDLIKRILLQQLGRPSVKKVMRWARI